MLTREDIHNLKEVINETIDERFIEFEEQCEERFIRLEKGFNRLENKFEILKQEIKDILAKFEPDMTKGYKQRGGDLKIVIVHR